MRFVFRRKISLFPVRDRKAITIEALDPREPMRQAGSSRPDICQNIILQVLTDLDFMSVTDKFQLSS